MFNVLTVLVFLPIEMATGYLQWLTGLIVNANSGESSVTNVDFLKEITEPFLKLIVQVDTKVIEKYLAWQKLNQTNISAPTKNLLKKCNSSCK